MFSRKFVATLRSSLVAIRQDRAASPAVIAVAQALQALSDEVDRVNPAISLSDSGAEITIATGQASVRLKSDGSVTISGGAVTINATGNVVVKSLKDVTLKGAKVLSN